MFFLQLRMYILIIFLFSILYAIVSMIGYAAGISSHSFYLIAALLMTGVQYMIGPKLIELFMGVRYIGRDENPGLYAMVADMAAKAQIPMPRVAISRLQIPNAFAFGRWLRDGRVCVTEGILRLLNEAELRAVLGHEIAHIKNRDVLTITMLSVVPLVLYHISRHLLWFGNRGNRRGQGNTAVVGLIALLAYFITNLLVLYASRIREYFADRGSVVLGNHPRHLATALYKLVYGSARAPRDSVRMVEGAKAFFINDPSRAGKELRELKEIDQDLSGSIDADELRALQNTAVRLSAADKLIELFGTHPNMLKRIKQLATYVQA
ncbi:MAG: zinc metalloprotease HtpX [Candidatus Omnitrophica bacterium]|nr:zinc metalloprotease HtpX [Candidatus Omnitrophota bacterium]